MGSESIEDFERELKQAFERRPAPPCLKRKLIEKRRAQRPPRRVFLWQRLAASVVLAAVLGGGVAWHSAEERRKGEAARDQVLHALRITGHALNQMNAEIAAHDKTEK